MNMSRVEPPPVRSAVQASTQHRTTTPSTSEAKYLQVADAFRKDNGAEARALRALFPTKDERDRFLAVVFSLLAKESKVLERCTVISIVDAIKTAASMGLEPGTSDGSIVAYGTKATFLPQWQGYLKRIRNSGEVRDVDCQLVYAGDEFQYRLGTDPWIEHIPARGEERGDYTDVYAWALMPSGKYLIDVMSVAEVNTIRDLYGAKDGDAWTKAYGEMARKTVIRRLAKRLPASAVQRLLLADQTADETGREPRPAQDRMADVRTMAMRAVGVEPAPLEEVPPPAEAEGDTQQATADEESDALQQGAGL